MELEPYLVKIAQIELTNKCNLQCAYCPTGKGTAYPKGFMSQETFEKALPYSTEAIELSLHGEPALHPHLCEFIGIAKQAGKRVFLHTNGITLTNDILQSGIETIEVSLHTRQSYEALENLIKANDKQIIVMSNVLSCNLSKLKTWGLTEEYLKYVRLSHLHNWAVGLPNNFDKNCPYKTKNLCVCKWDGTILDCGFDFDGTTAMGTVDGFPLEHKPEYPLCSHCSVDWSNNFICYSRPIRWGEL